MQAASDKRVLVVGGGPAGSTTATLIARQGFAVTLVERERGPRYHIGESLLPSCLRIFDLIGVREKIEAHGFVRKDGAFFDWGNQHWQVDFGGPAAAAYGFQVIRSEFDRLLLDHAKSQGVEVLEGVEVADLRFDAAGRPFAADTIDAAGAARRIGFDILADASGRAGLMATRYLRNRQYHEVFRNVALWGYWRDAKRLPVGPAGAIATCSIPSGWVWAIPLHDGSLSVGVVLHRNRMKALRQHVGLEQIYADCIAETRTVADLVEGASLAGPLKTETDYSYAAEHFAGPGYYLVGDAACFLDPLLSTGVHLATFSGLIAAAAIVSQLKGDTAADEAAAFYNASYRRAYLRMLVVVGAFYQTHQGKDAYFRQAQALTSRDYSDAELVDAFRHIITGVEDLADVEASKRDGLLQSLTHLYEQHFTFIASKHRWNELPLEAIDQARARTRFVNAVQEDFTLTPQTAIGGLYVAADANGLGLRRAEPVAAE